MTFNNLLTIFLIVVIYAIVYAGMNIILKTAKKKKDISFIFSIQILKVIVLISLIVTCLLKFQIIKDISATLIAGSSLIVAVVGFAAQESLNNIISGIMISREKPFDIGQRIVIEEKNITGTVIDITLRHTVIRKFNNAIIIVPNSIMNKVVIENSSNNENEIANFIDVSVAYESDIEKAKQIICDVVMSHKLYLKDKEPDVLVRELGVDGYMVRATVWTNNVADNFEACSDIRIAIKKKFDENNIEIPYIHVKTIH